MDLRIIKNVLDRKTFAALEEKLFKEFNSFPWYYAPHLVAGDDYFHLVHNFCANDRVNSPFYSNFLPVLKILNPKRLIRMRGSLLGRTHEKEKHVFHTDFKNCRTALFYLNTTNGPTLSKINFLFNLQYITHVFLSFFNNKFFKGSESFIV